MVTRREFLKALAGTGPAGLPGGSDALLDLSPASVAESRVTAGRVQLRPEIEPVVALIENTPQ